MEPEPSSEAIGCSMRVWESGVLYAERSVQEESWGGEAAGIDIATCERMQFPAGPHSGAESRCGHRFSLCRIHGADIYIFSLLTMQKGSLVSFTWQLFIYHHVHYLAFKYILSFWEPRVQWWSTTIS